MLEANIFLYILEHDNLTPAWEHLYLVFPPAGKLSPDFLIVTFSGHSVSSHISSQKLFLTTQSFYQIPWYGFYFIYVFIV